jgi:CheY-like chemotaxis protein
MCRGMTILVTDDEYAVRILLEEFLSLRGYNILTAKNGKEAVGIAETKGIDCFVMDVKMPFMNGIEAFRRIRAQEEYADAAFVFVTATPDVPELQEILSRYRRVRCLQKPFRELDVYRVLDEALDGS